MIIHFFPSILNINFPLMKNDNDHNFYISRCFELAIKGKGKVEPNPLVGSVIVKEGKIIGEGYHEIFGEAHAEVNAINNSTESVKGATLYCNLEPCCHTNKKTPPCAPFIIRSGISEVIISNIDPNPKVSGKGITMLENAGIKVVSGILEEEGKSLNSVFFDRISLNK